MTGKDQLIPSDLLSATYAHFHGQLVIIFEAQLETSRFQSGNHVYDASESLPCEALHVNLTVLLLLLL